MSFQRVADYIGVDAGMIMVGDLRYLKSVPSSPSELSDMGVLFDDIPKGSHRVHWHIKETYNGAIEGTVDLQVVSGKVFVCDPCYIIGREGNDWSDYLKKTDHCRELGSNLAFIIDEMGGDGCYKVRLDFEAVVRKVVKSPKNVTLKNDVKLKKEKEAFKISKDYELIG